MGKAGRWFRSLWGSKKPSPPSRERKGKWVLPKNGDNSFRNDDPFTIEGVDANKHAIAVAAATAAVAEAALAAAHAAAEVVRLTSSSGGGSGRNVAAYISSERVRVSAAIKIQSAFRAYLARRALRALKALVKLQALVRGHIVRKQSADMLKRMQAMARIQARASAHRSEFCSSANTYMLSSHKPGVIHPQSYDRKMSASRHRESALKMQLHHPRSHTNSLDHWMKQSSWNNYHGANRVQDDLSDKILEIDTWMPREQPGFSDRTMHLPRYAPEQKYSKSSYLSMPSSKTVKPNPSISSEETTNLEDQAPIWTAESSPRVRSATSSLRGSMARTDCSRSVFGDYLSHPNYMANTESSRAKVRSHSVPKQRMQVETRNLWDNNDSISEKGYAPMANCSEPCLNSGYLKRQGSRPRGVTNGIGSNSGYGLQDSFFYG